MTENYIKSIEKKPNILILYVITKVFSFLNEQSLITSSIRMIKTHLEDYVMSEEYIRVVQ